MMAGITSTQLKIPRLSKRIWVALFIAIIFICGFVLVPGIVYFNYQVEWRVNAAVHMMPDAELRYSGTAEKNGIVVKKLIYWINLPFEQVKDYPFVTNYRENSDPIKANSFIEMTPNYSHRLYFLSDLPQNEFDSMLYFAPSDLRDDPFRLTTLWFYIISANWIGEDYLVNNLDYERLAGKETTGTYIAYTYRIR